MRVKEIQIVLMLMVVSAGRLIAATNTVDEKLQKQANAAMARGVSWLEAQQAADGRLGPEKYPAVTALAISWLSGSDQVAVRVRPRKRKELAGDVWLGAGMPRPWRIRYAGAKYHVTSRGNGRDP